MLRKKLAVAAAAVTLTLGLSACVQQAGTPTTPGGAGGESVTIGIKFNQPGLGLKEGDTYSGFDVEVAKYIANELGYTNINWVETPSNAREDMIANGQVNMILATYSITDSRKEKVSFAGPYFVAGQGLLVREDDTSITGPESLDGKKLCSVSGSTPAQKIKDEYAEQVDLQEFPDYATCITQLEAGGVDAVTTDDVILAGFAAQPQYVGKIKVVGDIFSQENYGVGIKKGDVELCNKIDAALRKMIDDGSWQKALDDTVGKTGFKPDASLNPPKQFDPCS